MHRFAVLAASCLLPALTAAGQPSRMAGSAPELVETGAPLFAVLSREAIGLESAPTDLQVLRDGRVVVIAGQEIAFGDGTRWEVYRKEVSEEQAHALTFALDADDTIYQAVAGGFARVDFGRDGQWRLVKVADWPGGASGDGPVPRHVIKAGTRWYWHASSGPILSWRPGEDARTVTAATAVETIFHFNGLDYLSDRSTPSIELLGAGDDPGLLDKLNQTSADLVTSFQPLPDGRALAGTSGTGIQVIDGTSVAPLAPDGMLGIGQHVRHICPAGPGVYAAAIENRGVVFFDLDGRVRQVLDRSLDHRLARIHHLVPGREGIVWGVLADSIVRIAFPSRVSHYGPIFATALMEAQPMRLDGRLWLLSDRKALRAAYDAHGLISGLMPDTPDGQSLFMLSSEPGMAVATTSHGAFYRAKEGWLPFARDTRHMYVLSATPVDERWVYAAEDEIGWLRRTGDGLAVDRFPAPGLGLVYHSAVERDGTIWVERGIGSVARIRPGRPAQGPPTVTLYGEREGVPRGWAQVFCVDGEVRFNIADYVQRFDETAGRLVPDEVFARNFAGLGTIVGRPGRDALGRLWITTEKGVFLFDGSLDAPRRLEERVDPGFQPWFLTFEDGGAVWMHAPGRLARYDPAMPTAPSGPMRAVITRLTIGNDRLILHNPAGAPTRLNYGDDSVGIHFMAPGDPFTASITFEVMLERDNDHPNWMTAGSSGSAVFTRLKEGRYTFGVRPRAGEHFGEVATLSFIVLPPWYRTSLAYVSYGLAAVGTILFVAWFPAYQGRREQARLEQLVAQRTHELLASQDQLKRAVESGSIGLWEFDPATAMFAWNEQCNAICGLPHGTPGVSLRGFQELLDPAERDAAAQAFSETIVSDAETRVEYRIRRADRTRRWVLAIGRSAPHPGGARAIMRGAMLDITERKLAEESIRSLNASLERRVAERTAALEASNRELEASNRELESFSYSVSHDLRAPLRGIDGWSLALLEDCAGMLDKTGRDYLARVRTECGRLNQLIDDLLKLSRTTRAEFHPVDLDLSTLVSDTARRVAGTWPGATVDFVCQPGLRAHGDPALLEAAVFNLLDNAWKFSSRTARPRVEFGRADTPHGPACFVRDNGAGFDMRHTRKLFGVFQRMHTQEEFPGTGVGLATVQRIVHRHGGWIWAESSPGNGATFFFTLTVDGPPPAPGTPHPPSTRGDPEATA